MCPQITKDIQQIPEDLDQTQRAEQVLRLLQNNGVQTSVLRPIDIVSNNVQKITLFMAQIYKPAMELFRLNEAAIPDAQTIEKAVLMQM